MHRTPAIQGSARRPPTATSARGDAVGELLEYAQWLARRKTNL
jgi:hypothetical protein